MNKTVMITGASSGIGMACAKIFAQNGFNLILVARRKHILDNLAARLESEFQVRCYAVELDVRDRAMVEEMYRFIPDDLKNISVLINNAGLALGLSTLDEGYPVDWDVMIDTNIKGLLYVSRIVMPVMVENGKGHIINIGSVAGREVYPKGNVYCSTKHAVDALTQSMRIDLLQHGIRVTQVSPGAVETEFSKVRFKGDEEKAERIYQGFTPLTPHDVAEVVWFCVSRPQHVNINDVLVMPTDQAAASIFNKKL
jgi:3-hydroxy acid dehydrogenase / malonic semialdehyde reductase